MPESEKIVAFFYDVPEKDHFIVSVAQHILSDIPKRADNQINFCAQCFPVYLDLISRLHEEWFIRDHEAQLQTLDDFWVVAGERVAGDIGGAKEWNGVGGQDLIYQIIPPDGSRECPADAQLLEFFRSKALVDKDGVVAR